MDLKDEVLEAVSNFISDEDSFTSLDISNYIKTKKIGVRHREVAEIVRQLYCDQGMCNYTRTLIDVNVINAGKQQAYLYHHPNVFPSSYDNVSQVALPVPQKDACVSNTNPTCVSNTNPTCINNSFADKYKTQKSDGRLEIPALWVKHLGWIHGQSIYAVLDTNYIILKESQNVSPNDHILCATVITDGRLRVPKTAFVKANFSLSGHEIELQNDCIIIKN